MAEGDFTYYHRTNLHGFRRKKVRITSAQLLALNATAQVLVPAPGRGLALLLDELRLRYNPGTIEYVSQAGAGAVTNRIVTVVNLTNTALTIAAQPAFPSYITFTIVDTTPSITAGTVTIVGKDRFGNTITEVANYANTGLTYRSVNAFAYVTSVTTAAFATLGGSGDETIIVGVEPLTAEDFAVRYGSISGLRVASVHSQGFLRGAEAFDDDAIVVSANLTNTTLTLTAEAAILPSVSQVVVTIVDTTVSLVAGGRITITGTAEDGASQSEEILFVAGTLVYVSQFAYATVTSVKTAGFTVLGGSGDETIKVGAAAGAKFAVARPEYTSLVPPENKALVLVMDTGEIASGNGTVDAAVMYRIVPMTIRD